MPATVRRLLNGRRVTMPGRRGKTMTRFEKIKAELTLEKLVDILLEGEIHTNYCFDTCLKATGDKYHCPYDNGADDLSRWDKDRCRKCAEEWLKEEVENGE